MHFITWTDTSTHLYVYIAVCQCEGQAALLVFTMPGCSGVTKLVIVLLALCHRPTAESEPTEEPTYVDELKGENWSKCIGGGVEAPCKTLLYAVSGNRSSLTVKIQGPTLHINSTVVFNSTTSLTLEGSSPMVELECECQNCGLIFTNSQDIRIRFVSLKGCGAVSWWSTKVLAAMFVYDCHNVVIQNSTFSSSVNATGLYIRDTFGKVEILHSTFQTSTSCESCSSISGLRIILLSSYEGGHESVGSASNYTIAHCHFRDNNNQGAMLFSTSSLGGGVELQIAENSTGNIVSFVDVCVENNTATWGGGMLIQFGGDARNNQVFVTRATFRNNSATKAGGGFDVGYIKGASDPPITNTVYVKECNFTGNSARYGAGTAIYASHTNCAKESDYNDSTLVFESCRWSGNVALFFGSTVDISPYSYDTLESIYFPHPKFINCVFTASNTLEQSKQNFLTNVGSFAVNAFEVFFQGVVHFYNHSFTPLHVTDGTVTFLPGTRACFKNNTGSQGGALALFGSSVLKVLPNTTLSFINNSASGDGGAIYQSTQNHHDFFSSRTCFIQNGSKMYHDANERPTLYFKGNRVGHTQQTGHAIYATTFLPCYFQQFTGVPFSEDGVMKALQEIAVFDFDNEMVAFATSPQAFDRNEEVSLPVIPGRLAQIDITMKDELNNTAPSVYRVIRNKKCPVDRQFMISRFKINSHEEGNCSMSLVSVNFRESLLKLNIILEKCPPGFYMDNTTQACSCSAYSNKQAYYGINSCHDQKINAYLSNNFWAGYDADRSLLTARCPSSFCMVELDKEVHGIQLPNTSLPAELQKTVCRPNRMGWLCGKCEANHTTYFHSPTYQCRPQRLCSWGVLFYFISEVFPIVAMFSVIAVFDIRFTTGTASGLVFFAQIIDTVTIRMKWVSKQPKLIEIFSVIHRVIYGLFNFNFFNLESASFCLLRNAQVLDVIVFKYISVLFAFILLLCIVLFLKFCSCNCLNTKRNIFVVGKNRSVIHSMSAVLVMCYAQCTNISFQILTKTTLRGAGNEPRHTVTLYGGIKYFSPDHLVYALAACFCLSTVVAIPPVLLFVYPGYLTVFSFCKLSESRPVQYVSSFFIKLKPFFDCFQGCYQDKLRFFSGVYFLGRVTILGIDAFVTSTSQSVLGMEITILIVLGMYALCHPFRTKTDNINTILILVNLSLIGVFTQLAYSQDRYEETRNVVLFAIIVRLVLLYLPIVCVVANAVKLVVCFFKKGRDGGGKEREENLPEGPENSCRAVIDHSYLPFQEVSVGSLDREVETSYSYRDREELLAYI